jgi:hypothetical protein
VRKREEKEGRKEKDGEREEWTFCIPGIKTNMNSREKRLLAIKFIKHKVKIPRIFLDPSNTSKH